MGLKQKEMPDKMNFQRYKAKTKRHKKEWNQWTIISVRKIISKMLVKLYEIYIVTNA